MPYNRPTLQQLIVQVAGDFATSIQGANALLRRSVLGVIAKVQAGMANLHFGYLDYIAKQAVPYTATGIFLIAWATFFGVPINGPTTSTGGFTATGTSGTDIPAGTIVSLADSSLFISTADVFIPVGGSVVIPVTAVLAGSDGNISIGSTGGLTVAIPGVNSSVTAAANFTGGSDGDTEDDIRNALLQRLANPPQGGAATDYVTWALEVPGVTRAWALGNVLGAGTVNVYTMFDESEAAHAGFPQGSNGGATLETRHTVATGDQLAVANHIYPLQPVTAEVWSFAPAPYPINFTISGLGALNTGVNQALIASAIQGVIFRNGDPTGKTTIDLSDINSAIAAVLPYGGFLITAPAGNVNPGVGNLATLGAVTYGA